MSAAPSVVEQVIQLRVERRDVDAWRELVEQVLRLLARAREENAQLRQHLRQLEQADR
jgi:BMFP domain-containing protein YqiC